MSAEPSRYLHWLPPLTLGERIIALRQERGWNLKDLAAKSGISYSTLSFAQTSRRGLTLGALNRVARAFGMTPSELLEGVDLTEWERAE